MTSLTNLHTLIDGNIIAICVFSFFGLTLAYFVFASAQEWSTLYYLSQRGILSEAEITNVIAHSTGRGVNYFIEYKYALGRQLYSGKQQISRKHYKQFQERDYITIRIAPSKPSWSRLADANFDNTYRNFSSYAAFAACLVFTPFIALWIATLIGTYVYLLFGLTGKKKKRSIT